MNELFAMELQDNTNARELHQNGAYTPVVRKDDEPAFSVQNYFIAAANQRRKEEIQLPEA